MQMIEILDNSHLQVIESVDDLNEALWDLPGVSGNWSVKDVIAHLTSYELLLIDILNTAQGEQVSPYVLRWRADLHEFNADMVESRRYHTAQQVLTEYQDAQMRASALLAAMPVELLEKQDALTERSVADIVVQLGRHIQQHCEQIVLFREQHKELE